MRQLPSRFACHACGRPDAAAIRGACNSAPTDSVIVETSHPTEIKHLLCMLNFHRMQSFHVNRWLDWAVSTIRRAILWRTTD